MSIRERKKTDDLVLETPPPLRRPHASTNSSALLDACEEMPAIAAVLDHRGIILALSREAAIRFGDNASRMAGRSIFSLAHRDDRLAIAAALDSALREPAEIAHCKFRVWRGTSPPLVLRTSIRAANSSGKSPTLLAVSSDITDEENLERQLGQRSDELAQMANQVLLAQNEERRRIASVLHDGVGHDLALAKFHIDGLKELSLDRQGQQAVKNAVSLLQDAIDAVRSMTLNLNTSLLNDQGLDAAVEALGQSLSVNESLHFSLSSRPRQQRLSKAARASLYRIIRELLVNVVKHAQANHVRVSMGAADGQMHIVVTDDGSGIQSNRNESAPGNGLAMVKSALQALDGSLQIAPGDSQGTRVHVSVPYAKIAEVTK